MDPRRGTDLWLLTLRAREFAVKELIGGFGSTKCIVHFVLYELKHGHFHRENQYLSLERGLELWRCMAFFLFRAELAKSAERGGIRMIGLFPFFSICASVPRLRDAK